MAAGWTFEDLMFTTLFFLAVWVGGKLFGLTGGTPLVGEIVVGMIMGPNVLDVVPFPDAVTLLGEIGLCVLICEAGLEVDLDMLKLVGFMGVTVAVVGSILPLAMGFGVAIAFGYDTVAALAAGASLAPTSMGIAINVLKTGKVLNTPTGQLIIAAAIVDDVIALVLLSELRAIADPSPAAIIIPIVSAVLYLGFGTLFATTVMPRVLPRISPHIPEDLRGNIFLGACLTLGLALMIACDYSKASYLLGAFLGGLSFCTSHECEVAWEKQVKRILYFLLHIFFAATIGFPIPVQDFWNWSTIARTAAFTCCMSGKWLTGLFGRPLSVTNFWTIGFAMSAWGEFAFLIASESYYVGTLTKDEYTPLAFAILLSAIISPFCLKFTLEYRNRQAKKEMEAGVTMARKHRKSLTVASVSDLSVAKNSSTVYYKIHAYAKSEWGMIARLFETAEELELNILETRVRAVRHGQALQVIYLSDRTMNLPFVCESGTPEAERMERRVRQIHDGYYDTLSGPGLDELIVVRWRPQEMGDNNSLELALLKDIEGYQKRLEVDTDHTQILARTSHSKPASDVGHEVEEDDNMVVEGYQTRRNRFEALYFDNTDLDWLLEKPEVEEQLPRKSILSVISGVRASLTGPPTELQESEMEMGVKGQ
ncbi:hypothetical protein SARC_00501 [Sphaeroforma arctica JP610]|uniref:Cation/H+ exchanger transmembrane domain-containing protein n=1 Tax=Sphaeroforma arctica JP610 TaxID=667725 RepID=A0A0L0GEB9_9EUKA|nr:hypothetical protein SARC_00501 [Sphaeroforma arctica JP610]KNC87360.1 hypothetical protein SARC_00501 [Sphaeroforma arctica JP610]|eukprot:XP_014161262.1 hypothetical protein SARC_00501 [Sphaeroforma arctica JP610]